MWTNLLQPLLLARVVAGLAAAALALVGLVAAGRIVAGWSAAGARSEAQLALERRAELVAAIVQVSLVFALVGLGLTVLAADRLAHSVSGAMCAWGVLASTRAGFLALGTSLGAAAATALWTVWHRLDLRMTRPTLTLAKFRSLFFLAPLVVVDFVVALTFALELDLSVVATCCSVSLDEAGGSAFLRGAAVADPTRLGAVGAGLAALALGLAALAARRPSPGRAWSAATASAAAAAASLPAITAYVAPHAYETPGHACPFCLLHADVGGLGWPLFGATFAAVVLGLGLGVVEAGVRRASEPPLARALQQRLGASAAAAWGLALALAAWPVVRWYLATGGAPLFGGAG